MSVLLSIYSWLVNALLILIWLPLMALVRIFDRDPAHYATGRMFRRLGATMTKANPFWKIDVSGKVPDNPRNPYVVICNHQSFADIPIVSLLPWEMKWVGKAELWRIPVIGWLMRLAGDIPVDRKDRRSRVNVLIKAREYLHKKCSVIFFPEGTRSKDGRVGRFNEGGLGLAIKEKLPVLVLALDGTSDALPKSSWVFSRSGSIRLTIVGEIWPDDYAGMDARTLTGHVRGMIVARLAEWRGCQPEDVDAMLTAGSRVG
ncbi:MAG: 1-acyl-sn-glycerol-3-phosphate acyltransferase [Rhodothermia bacterium]|nr:1-acyl-sn-glycerol-3-phosphate acyltransferase [Rhodothermia bacterium]